MIQHEEVSTCGDKVEVEGQQSTGAREIHGRESEDTTDQVSNILFYA